MRQGLRIILAGLILMAGAQSADAQVFKVTLAGRNEIPAVPSPGTGSAIVTFNASNHELRVSSVFAGLVAPSTASHLHCCLVQPANAGVATTVPTFPGFPLNVTSGSWDRVYDLTQASSWNPAFIAANGGTVAGAEAALLSGTLAGQTYLNIHSVTFPGGEIRGDLIRSLFASTAGLSSSAQGAAAGLDSLGAGTGATSDVVVALALLAPAQQAAALERLAPSASRGPWLVKAFGMAAAFDQVDGRLGGAALAGGSEGPARGVWLKGFGDQTRDKMSDGFAGFENDGWGLAGGIDLRVAPDTAVGAALSYYDASLSYRDGLAGNGEDITSTQLTVYGAHAFGRGYVHAMAAYAQQRNKSARDTGVSGRASGSYDGSQWGARLGGGFPFAVTPHLTATPQAHVDWYDISHDGYRETGGGPMALAVASRSAQLVRSSLGAQLTYDADGGGGTVRPFARGFWNHDFKNDGIASTASFVGGGTSFTTPGQALESNSYSLGAGVNFYSQRGLSAAVAYDATFADSYRSHVWQAKVRWAF